MTATIGMVGPAVTMAGRKMVEGLEGLRVDRSARQTFPAFDPSNPVAIRRPCPTCHATTVDHPLAGPGILHSSPLIILFPQVETSPGLRLHLLVVTTNGGPMTGAWQPFPPCAIYHS